MREGYAKGCGRVLLSLILLSYGVSTPQGALGGGPLVVGGTFGVAGQPFTWDLSSFPNGQISYRTDGGGLGNLSNAQANALVQSMFQVWQDVPTSNIAFTRVGQIQVNGTDTDIQTATNFDAVACPSSGPIANMNQNPIIYDSTGSLFTSLGFSSGVIGFASLGTLSSAGRITCALAALNGQFLTSGMLSQDEFATAFIHEFGHFSGLDHSQINLNCLSGACAHDSEDAKGLPTMFPFLVRSVTETVGSPPTQTVVPAQKTLAADDMGWISRLYLETANSPTQVPFTSQYATISGSVFFSDGITGVQGVNVIARKQGEERRTAVSVVSGYAFTVGIGNPVLCPGLVPGAGPACPSTLGSRDLAKSGSFDIPVPPGTYTLQLESIDPDFVGGSSVGPLFAPIPMPGSPPLTPTTVTVAAGESAMVPNIVLQNTPPRFDAFESARNEAPGPQPLWERKEGLLRGHKEAA